jgi:hypothetical protein
MKSILREERRFKIIYFNGDLISRNLILLLLNLSLEFHGELDRLTKVAIWLMAEVSRQRMVDYPNKARETVRPCELFDFIGGTSTDGIIALMLGRLEMV